MSGSSRSTNIEHFTRQDKAMSKDLDRMLEILKLEQDLVDEKNKLTDKEKEALNKELSDLQKKLGLELSNAKEIEKLKDSYAEKRRKEDKKIAENAASMLTSVFAKQRQQLESYMTSLNTMRESIAYGIRGTNASLSSIVNNINAAVGASNVVKQESLYRNLQSLIESGIVYNAEQRAYLTTL